MNVSNQPAATAATQIANQLQTSKSLNPSQTWLTTFLSTQRPTTPIPALTQSALFRLLASDITQTLDPTTTPSTCFPADIHNPEIKDRRLQGTIIVQVLDIEDMSRSRWEQIEAIEALERGEGTKGREIIRVVQSEEGDDAYSGDLGLGMRGGSHKLQLQDARGVRVYGIELRNVVGLGLDMNIGCKLALKGASVARGVVLLEPSAVTVLGGKIEDLHKKWRDTRKAQLRAAIGGRE